MTIERIVEDILTYQEDNPHIALTKKDIEDLIEAFKQDIINEVIKELEDKGGRLI